jgi:hypothetical protein
LKIPTHSTVLNWIKKHGINNFKDSSFYQNEKWVLILDESVQFGDKKLLLALAVPEGRCSQKKALSYKDLIPLVLKVGTSWKSKDIFNEINQSIDIKQISYCISDTGSNLICTSKLLNSTHIVDVNHKFSSIIKSVFEKNSLFISYTKALSLIRSQKSISKYARIVPPNQRVMSRFMNLMPLFKWGVKMINNIDNNVLTEEEKTILSFLEPMRDFIFDTYQILICLNNIQKSFKNKGFNETTAKDAISAISKIESANSLKIKELLYKYIEDLRTKAKEKESICCSSDIIESCFGKYKEIVKGNKTVGISDLSLCIAAIMGLNNPDKTKKAMETVSMKQVKEWKTKRISKTLFAEKLELNKNRTKNI